MKKLCLLFVALLSLTVLPVDAALTFTHLGDTTGQPADIQSELSRLQTLIAPYPCLPTPSLENGWTGTQTPVENGLSSFTMDFTGFNGYLLLKWGNQDCFYYINENPLECATPIVVNGVTVGWESATTPGLYTFQSDNYDRTIWNRSSTDMLAYAPPPPAGLSHYTTFTPVPEPATLMAGALLLLPFGLSTMRILRRR